MFHANFSLTSNKQVFFFSLVDLEGPIRLLYFELIYGSKATIDCLVSSLNSMHTTFDASSNEIHCHGKVDEDVW